MKQPRSDEERYGTYITSRGYSLPRTATEMEDGVWFNMWRRKLWPYRELLPSDLLYWYESVFGKLVWKTRVLQVIRFEYKDKATAAHRLEQELGKIRKAQRYFVQAPVHGVCLAYKVSPLQKLNISKPKKFRFPHEGWLRLNEQTARLWSLPSAERETAILDDIVLGGTHVEKIRLLDVAMKELPPKRVFSVVMQTIRRDTQLIKALKELCDFRCQFPGCGERIRKRDGTFYVEVAHIKPVRAGGRSVLGNLLVLCPNHHKEFDHGDLRIEEQTVETLAGTLNSKSFEIRLPR